MARVKRIRVELVVVFALEVTVFGAILFLGQPARIQADGARPIITLGGARVTPPGRANELRILFGPDGRIIAADWQHDNVVIEPLEFPDGTPVSKDRPADSVCIGSTAGAPAAVPGDPKPPGRANALRILFGPDGRIIAADWQHDTVALEPLEFPDGTVVSKDKPAEAGCFGKASTGFAVGLRPLLPVKVVVPGVAGDSSECGPSAIPKECAPESPPPPQTLPKAPVIKTLGCTSTAKVNQLIACQSEGVPGDANSPVTLLEWHAPGGTPDAGFDGIVFLTKFPEPGVKEISLKACSGDACTTLTQNVTVTADAPPGPQTLAGSGTFTLFEQSGQCEGLTIAEVLQLSLSLAPTGTSVVVSVTNKGWSSTFGTWTDEPGGKLLSATGQNLPNPPAGVTAYHFSIAGHYNSTTKVLAWETASGFSLFYDRPGDQRCIARYSYNIQLN